MASVGLIDAGNKQLTPMPHSGLAYLAAALEQGGHKAAILDVGISTKDEVDRFFRTPFDVLGVTATSFSFRNAVDAIRAFNRLNPEVPVVIGGPHVSIAQESIFECEEIDFAVYGEGEEAIKELVALLIRGPQDSQDDYGRILGLMYRKNGKIQTNPERPRNRALDDLPFPAYQSLPMERYEVYPLITSRGCPYRCTYCAAHILCGGLWRGRSAENLLGEIKYLQTNWEPKPVAVCDDNFNVRVDRVKRFCDLLIDNKIKMEWQCWSFRADRADPDMLTAMRDSGCNSIAVGVESANPTVLKNIKKNETREAIAEGIRNVLESGISCQTLNMIGNQGDNLDTIRETMAFSRKLKVDAATFFLAIPYPKTELWDYVEKNGRFLKSDYTQFHHFCAEPIFETDDFTKEQRMKAYRMARRFELEMKLRFGFRQKLKRLRRGDLRGIGLGQVMRSVLYLGKLAFNYAVCRKEKV